MKFVFFFNFNAEKVISTSQVAPDLHEARVLNLVWRALAVGIPCAELVDVVTSIFISATVVQTTLELPLRVDDSHG